MRSVTLLLVAALCAVVLAAPPSSEASGASNWAFADEVSAELAPSFDPDQGLYMTTPYEVHISSSMLAVHARAAIADHEGASRNDEALRLLARRMVTWPIYIDDPRQGYGRHRHAPGFTIGVSRPGEQHVSFDMQIANALALAVKSGELPSGTEELIRERIPKVAATRDFAYPEVKLNQVNWPIQMWANAGRMQDDFTRANREVRGQMQQWVAGMVAPMRGREVPNLSRGLGLHYLPESRNAQANVVSTTEYANLIYAGFDVYDEMLANGMKPLGPKSESRMRTWAGRLIRGDWTHGGWPNWDTGHGYERWQLMRYWPWAAEGLATISTSTRLARTSDRRHAAWLLDRVFDRYRWLREQGPIGATRYGIKTEFGKEFDGQITAARLAAIATRVATGNPAEPQEPGRYWWFDTEMQRLAVSSPAYSAAVMAPVPRPKYGGLEITRLLDSQGRVLTTLGANQAQSGITTGDGVRSQGNSATPRSYFGRMSASGNRTTGSVAISGSTANGVIDVSHRFRATTILSSYRVRRAPAVLRIPLWGTLTTRALEQDTNRITLKTQNTEGASMSLVIRSSVPIEGRIRSIGRQPASPGSRRRLEVSFARPGQLSVEARPLS